MYNDYYYTAYFDWSFLLVIISGLISFIASLYINSTYSSYHAVLCDARITGAQAAEKILYANGLYDVRIERVGGHLTDHYNPGKKIVCLSDTVYDSTSVAALGVAAHECGHAVQHQQEYIPLRFRSALLPVANFGARAGIPIFCLGLFLSANVILMKAGIILFFFAIAFQLVTLPVEINASRRALAMLEQYGILGHSENDKARKVLTAAALTYVAAAAASLLQFCRLIFLLRSSDD